MRRQRVTPAQFDTLQGTLLRAECEGHGPEACVLLACEAARIAPPAPSEPVEIVVDYQLEGGAHD